MVYQFYSNIIKMNKRNIAAVISSVLEQESTTDSTFISILKFMSLQSLNHHNALLTSSASFWKLPKRKRMANQNVLVDVLSFIPGPVNPEAWISHYDDSVFSTCFKMSKLTYEKFLGLLVPIIPTVYHYGGNSEVPTEKKLLIMLWYLGSNDSMSSISERFNIAKSTVKKIVDHLIPLISGLSNKLIVWPTLEERKCIEEKFRLLSGLPGAIGCIGSCHIMSNRKQHKNLTNKSVTKSFFLQGVCTAEKIFINVSIGFPGGSANECQILNNSHLLKCLNENGTDKYFAPNYHLLGNPSYPCKKWLIVPYQDNSLSVEEMIFNVKQRKGYSAIEEAFSELKGRWQRMLRINAWDKDFEKQTVMAACVLHNFCILQNDLLDDAFEWDDTSLAFQEIISSNKSVMASGNKKRLIMCFK